MIQTWKPNTCKCELEESVTNGVVSFSKVIKKCNDHQTVIDAELWDVICGGVSSEQGRIAEFERQINKSSVMVTLTQEEKRLIRLVLKVLNRESIQLPDKILDPEKKVTKSFTGTGKDRILQINLANFTTNQKNEIKIEVEKSVSNNKFTIT